MNIAILSVRNTAGKLAVSSQQSRDISKGRKFKLIYDR